MNEITFNGMVVGELDKAEKGKTLIVLTAEKGIIYVQAPGAHKISSSYLKSAQLFAYSNFLCYINKDYYLIKEANLYEDFFDLRSDYQGYCLASYVVDVAQSVAVDSSDCKEILSLALNTLYCITKKVYPYEHIRCVFESRLAMLLGFIPDLYNCPFCDEENGDKPMVFDLEDGFVCCASCLPEDAESQVCATISKGTLLALKYIASAPAKQVFAFSIDKKSETQLSAICEKYLHLRTERKYKTLSVYKDALKQI